MRLAERFSQSPYGPWERLSAAQVAVIAAALREEEVTETKESASARELRTQQPRLNRDVLLAIAREQDANIVDARERYG